MDNNKDKNYRMVECTFKSVFKFQHDYIEQPIHYHLFIFFSLSDFPKFVFISNTKLMEFNLTAIGVSSAILSS